MKRSDCKRKVLRCTICSLSGMVLIVLFHAGCFLAVPGTASTSAAGLNSGPASYSHRRYLELKLKPILEDMSLRQKASQILMTGIDGKDFFQSWSYRHFSDHVPGAIILFRYNLADDPDAVRTFLFSCQDAFTSLGSAVPVLFVIDHEGGSVYRTGGLTSRLPSQREIASVFDPDKAREVYRIAGKQLVSLGINMNLAPVAESAGTDSFMSERVFSDEPHRSFTYSRAAYAGYRSAGIIPVLKHFPGNAETDPHDGLPHIRETRLQLLEGSAGTFQSLFTLQPPAVLVSSVIVDDLDPANPFCLSYAGVNGFLRGELGYHGLVLTDDIAMSAIRTSGISPATAAVRALKAGCDMVMTSDPDIRSIVRAIMHEAVNNQDFHNRLDEAVLRILILKFEAGLIGDQLYTENTSRQLHNTNSEFLKKTGDAILRSGGF